MKQLLPIDLFLGGLVGSFTWLWLGPWTSLVIIASALLWALGGQYGHSIRVFGVPAVLCIPIILINMPNWLLPVLSYPFMALILSCGYGIPSTQPPDAGSPLGRFWWAKTGHKPFLTDILTRGTIILGVALCMTPWLFLLHK